MDEDRADKTVSKLRFRDVRIAWTAFWGLAAVLLVVLWPRSHWRIDSCQGPLLTTSVHLQSARGYVAIFYSDRYARWQVGSSPAAFTSVRGMLSSPQIGTADYVQIFNGWTRLVVIADWASLTLVALIGALPWLPWSTRYSLRTLLMSTTLASLALGAVLWGFSKNVATPPRVPSPPQITKLRGVGKRPLGAVQGP